MARSPLQPTWQPPSLEEFFTDIERRRLQPVLYNCSNFGTVTNFLAETGQENDPIELMEARNMALATRGVYTSCTPTMAWNYHFGDMNDFYAERFAQVGAQNFISRSQDVRRQRPKRAAAERASNAWKGLSPHKRQRRQ
ncbi:hypothetical protein P152DRAFT_213623 [Eremomyces bilateralis CBS 781.70]|uniref:Uncharacterized protein n=1 Tax=Eremomyces bilateralis CBS 781.70 TaxID=1392243 RepID=A0A6G1FSN0_9PEZI|nr:uncharacterized protein P152DRAFT_222684 [Eremomyces bilateralis CBS 781.70]XP_033530361.1 uncharacterized protein P152DRAFT_213623 [Eremomyces bilateralis CBS 781.70]KAF1808451.1 hypothetical protein P152DRAFT_222684 [Eremomyces bilateralis CBS 781.70]KAF1808730.1 hypothetical protein P152DRAFT_213623 [Eremomyces bilateralis CBS 781.70]